MTPQHPEHPPAPAPAYAAPAPAAGIGPALRRLVAPTREELPPVRAWGPWWAGVLVVVAFVALVFGADELLPHGLWAPTILEASLLVLVVGLVLVRRRSLPPASSPLRDARTRLRWIAGGAVAVIAVGTLVADPLSHVLPDMKGIGHPVGSGFEGRTAAFVSMVLLAPLVEETVFRGWLLRSLTTRIAPVYAVLVTGVVFGMLHVWLAHYALGMGIELVFVGWTLSLLCLHSGSLLPNIAGHMTLNFIAVMSVIEGRVDDLAGLVLLVAGIVLAVRWLRANRRRATRTTLAASPAGVAQSVGATTTAAGSAGAAKRAASVTSAG